jgi:2-hydroxychromene-2-carboxylate isomerase
VSVSAAGPAPTVQFWFEFASTYTYPAAMRIEQRCREQGRPLEWRPFLLGPIFAAQGWVDSPFNLFPARGRYMWRDLERTCASLGLPFRRPSRFPRNGLLAARVACLGLGEPWLGGFVRAVFHANFVLNREIAEPGVVYDILDREGLPAAILLERARSDACKTDLRRLTEDARRLGIFGAPSFVVAGELFWGNDRLDDALAWRPGSVRTPAHDQALTPPQR